MFNERAPLDVFRRPPFSALADAERAALGLFLPARRYAAGEVVFREGERGDSMLLVADGTLMAARASDEGGHETLGPGEMVEEMAFLDPGPRIFTITAATETTAFEVGGAAMAILRMRAPQAAWAMVQAALLGVSRKLGRFEARLDAELHAVRMGSRR